MLRKNEQFWGYILRHRLLIYSFFVSLVILSICTKSSFLYPFNDWVDANCYFTVGKGMMQGKVVYRDLFEQKGVLLYFLHGLAYLVSHTTFIGVFFIELIAGTAYLYYAGRTAALFAGGKWPYVIIPVLAALVYSSLYFAHGDSAEELCLPMLMYGFYRLMRFFKEPGSLTPRVIVVCGILAACVLWIKYTMLGWWLAFMIAVIVERLLKKQVNKALMFCVWFAAGALVATLPWLIYFAVNKAIHDWVYTYFILNITAYANSASISDIFHYVWNNFYTNMSTDIMLLISILLGLLGFVGTRKLISGIWAKISIVFLPMLLVLGIYGGGRNYPYYFLIVSGMLLLPGMITLVRLLSGIGGVIKSSKIRAKLALASRWLFALGCVVVVAASALYTLNAYQYRGFMSADRSGLAQVQFAEIMNETETPTLLNYGFLDGGFYTAANILPTEKYFCKLNVPLNKMIKAQDAAVRNKLVQYVVTRIDSNNKSISKNRLDVLEKNYQLKAQVQQMFEHRKFTYRLYKLREGV